MKWFLPRIRVSFGLKRLRRMSWTLTLLVEIG
jgi:hypothetical protein